MLGKNIITRSIMSSLVVSMAVGLASTSAVAANLSNVPIYTASKVDPNILINLSVEGPMGGAAYNDQNDIADGGSCYGRTTSLDLGHCYTPTKVYIGYFDPDKCYTYQNTRFEPTSGTTDSAKHTCSGNYSGNFMNWATMTAMDSFIYTMTGGNRVVDTTSLTVVERAKKVASDSWFPYKYFTETDGVSPNDVTPYGGTEIYINNDDNEWEVDFGTSKGGHEHVDDLEVRIKVCDENITGLTASESLEDNCVAYTDGVDTYYKPVGLIQKNAANKRFAVTSYLATGRTDGGVLRAKMKYVGPDMPETAGFGSRKTNDYAEFDADGILNSDPDQQSAVAGVDDSGVINYINKFTRVHGYKSLDPASELFYESLRYFRGQDITSHGPTTDYLAIVNAEKGGFPAYTTWDDPITNWCQQNFIIGINDANPWYDKKLPGTHFTSSTYYGHSLNGSDYGTPSNPDNWFNVKQYTNKVGDLQSLNGTTRCIACVSGDCPEDPSHSYNLFGYKNPVTDKTMNKLGEVYGTCPAGYKENSYYIAGLAYQAHTEDMRDDLDGVQTVTTFMIDTQEYNETPLVGEMNMLWLAGKYGGFNDYDDDKEPDDASGDDPSEWDANDDGQPDNYVLVTKPEKMVAALNNAFGTIDELNSSSSAVVANSTRLTSGTRIYQARFSTGDWSGDLVAYSLNLDGSINAQVWSSQDELQSQSWETGRKIFTYDAANGDGQIFKWSSLTATQQAALDLSPVTSTADGNGEDRVEYIRGNDAKEQKKTNGIFRDRDYKLGDIVNSSPVYVGPPLFNYSDSIVNIGGGDESYNTFAQSNATRTAVLYAGGNDGMLHGFNATTGVEMMAYVPGFLLPELNELTSPLYSHRYYVDGNPSMGDVLFASDQKWHTVLAGGARAGGQGIYLLDITDPTSFTESTPNAQKLALWEFSDADDADLGYTFSQPAIVKMQNEKWAVIIGNGYHNTEADGNASASGHAVLYILFIDGGVDGTWTLSNADTTDYVKIDTGVGDASDPNGLATVAPVDIDGDNVIDYIYAGDLYGNLWKFDVSDSNNLKTKWKVEGGKPLFTAKNDSAEVQPITVRPDVGLHPLGGYMVYFGTGKYFEEGDGNPNNYGTQTFYGVRDDESTKELTRSALQEQEIKGYVAETGADYRVTTDNTVDWTTKKGWYMDLPDTGELVAYSPQLRYDNIVFVTQTPESDPCGYGGSSWVMIVDAVTGGWPDESVFDVNGDNVFDTDDFVTYGDQPNMATGWRESGGGNIYTPPNFISAGDKDYFKSNTSGGDRPVGDKTRGDANAGRQSWEQIR